MRNILLIGGIILLALLLIFILFYPRKVYRVGDFSMSPNLPPDEVLDIKRAGNLKRGHVIIFELTLPNGSKIESVKRVIGLPDEIVKIEDGNLYVHKKVDDKDFSLDESGYLEDDVRTETRDNKMLTVETGEDEYFVMGDNRENSYDSRDWGVLKREDIIGRIRGTADYDALMN